MIPAIRLARPVDAEAVALVYLSARRAAGDYFPPSVHDDDTEFLPHLLADAFPSGEIWLAERASQAVGMLVLRDHLLDQLFVTPAAQGTGVGTALLRHAQRRRPEGLNLWVFASNLPARRFYEQAGFVVIGGSDGTANEEGAPDLLLRWEPET